jgi:Protein of unknown function (DUF2442)
MTVPRRIAAVSPGDVPLTLRVRWEQGAESLIDVSGMIESYKVYAPLRQSPELFRKVRVGEYGTDVIWTDAIDMSADTLWRLSEAARQSRLVAEATSEEELSFLDHLLEDVAP